MSNIKSGDTHPIQPHEENYADRIVDGIHAVYFRVPPYIIYGIASIGLALSNFNDPRGGMSTVIVYSWGLPLAVYHVLMTLLLLAGVLLLAWRFVTKRPPPAWLFGLYLFYVGGVTIAIFSSFAVGDRTFGSFGKVLFSHLPHAWLLTREVFWPE